MNENDDDNINETGADISNIRDNLLFPTQKVQHSMLADFFYIFNDRMRLPQ